LIGFVWLVFLLSLLWDGLLIDIVVFDEKGCLGGGVVE